MGRKRSTNTNLPDRMRARKRTRKNGKTTVYYFYDGRDETDGAKKSRWARTTLPPYGSGRNTKQPNCPSPPVLPSLLPPNATCRISSATAAATPFPAPTTPCVSCLSFSAGRTRRHWMKSNRHTSAVISTGAKTHPAAPTTKSVISAPSLTMPESRAGQAKKTHAETSRSTARSAVRFILRITYIRPSIKPPASRCET